MEQDKMVVNGRQGADGSWREPRGAARGLDDENEAIEYDLRWLDAIYALERRNLRERFNREELGVLAAIFDGSIWDEPIFGLVRAGVEDAEDGYFDAWKVDRAELLSKLRDLTWAQEAALIASMDRWWHIDDPEADPATLLDDYDTASDAPVRPFTIVG